MKQKNTMILVRQMDIMAFSVAFSTFAVALGMFLAFEAHVI